MKLLKLTVGGFRNLAETTIELEGITAFVSPNNYGKSNLMDAIQFAADFINESPRARSSMMAYVNGMPLVSKLENSNYMFEMEFEDPHLEEYRFVRYGFSFSWAKDGEGGRKIVDEKIELSNKEGGLWTTYLRRDKGQYKKSHDTRSFRKIVLDPNQLAIDILTSIDDIDINPAIRRIKSISFAMCDSLDAGGRFRPLPIEIEGKKLSEDAIAFDDEDLPRSLFRLKNQAPDKFDDFLSAVYTLFPEFEDISVSAYEIKQEEHDRLSKSFQRDDSDDAVPFHIKDEMYKVVVRDSYLNQPVDISRMSTGTKRLIWLIANVIIAGEVNAGCVGIEEIETSIHPKMLQELLEILNDSKRETALLLTSHSPFLIQYLKPQQIYLGVPNDEGVAVFKRIADSKLQTVLDNAHNRGLGFGEYLFELMSSDDDTSRLPRILEA